MMLGWAVSFSFLMYRVELKVNSFKLNLKKVVSVPNVPCGVESYLITVFLLHPKPVPNVPCGVESFKMHET